MYSEVDSSFNFSFFENLEKSRVATEYVHATPTLRPAYFHFAVYVEMSYFLFLDVGLHGWVSTSRYSRSCTKGTLSQEGFVNSTFFSSAISVVFGETAERCIHPRLIFFVLR